MKRLNLTILVFILTSLTVLGGVPPPAPAPEQTSNPRVVETKYGFIAYEANTGYTGNSYVTIYNWLSADQTRDKMILIKNLSSTNDLDFSITLGGLNIGTIEFPLVIGIMEYSDVTLARSDGVLIEFDDPASVVKVKVKSTQEDAPAQFSVQATGFK